MLRTEHLDARSALILAAALIALAPGVALAHAATAHVAPGDVVTRWTLEAQVIIPIAGMVWIYARGVRRVWRHAGVGRGVGIGHVAAFALAVVALLVALVSPLDAAADALFTAHMLQHTLLMLVAAPLLVLSAPAVAFAWALPTEAHPALHALQRARAVTRAAGVLLHPGFIWLQFAVVFWAWHVPALYDAALRHDSLHATEHATLLGSALLFWWLVLHRAGRRTFPYPAAVAFVFTTMLQMMIVPVLLSFSGSTWYAYYDSIDPAWHLSQLRDQQIGGLTMWMISNAVFIVLGIYLVARWLLDDERRADAEAQRDVTRRDVEARRSWLTP